MRDPLPIEDGLPDPATAWPKEVIDACSEFQSGDAIEDPPLFYFADVRYPIWAASHDYASQAQEHQESGEIVDAIEYAPVYGLITSQTCDIGEIDFSPRRRPWVMISPVYDLQALDAAVVGAIKRGRHSQFMMHLPALSTPSNEVWVADLRIEVPVEKSALVGRRPLKTFATELEQRAVAIRVAALRGRPAWSMVIADVCNLLATFLRQTKSADRALWEQVVNGVSEIGARVDSMLSPTTAQLCIFTDGPTSGEVTDWWDRFYQLASSSITTVNLQVSDIQDLDVCPVAMFRQFQPIPFSGFGSAT